MGYSPWGPKETDTHASQAPSLDAACSREVPSLCPFTPFDENLEKSSMAERPKSALPPFTVTKLKARGCC